VLERVLPPEPVAPGRWHLDPRSADEDGVVGAGADLEAPTLVSAYRLGVFPWPHEGLPLLWFSPDPRAVLDPAAVHVSRSLGRRMRSCGWTTTMDRAFPDVMAACADRSDTWITPAMRTAYGSLRELGWARSLEVWEGDRLVGGLYGVQIGGMMTGESMFHVRTDASKVALVDLCARLVEAGGGLLDVQLPTAHLRSLGAVTVPREEFLGALAALGTRSVLPVAAELPVRRLAPG
jgi:leucyl/phenylalanyl-tRNA--protein transferase